MFSISHTPFLRLLISLIVGIVLEYCRIIPPILIIHLLFLLVLLVYILLLYLREKNHSFDRLGKAISFIGLLGISIVGVLHSYKNNPLNNKFHIINIGEEFNAYIGKLVYIKQKETTCQLTLKLKYVIIKDKKKYCTGYVQVFLKKAPVKNYTCGDLIKVSGKLQKIPPTKNPYTFDYQHFLTLKYIHHRSYVNPTKVSLIKKASHSIIKKHLELFREKVGISLQRIFIKESNRAILQALLIGEKNYLSTDTQKTFASAGVLHILALSGLHVSIIINMLIWLFSYFYSRRKKYFVIGLLAFLWSYAWITRFPTSLLRAVIMTSIMQVGNYFDRQSFSWNNLFASAFFILLYNPNALFEQNFQLSYLALIGIFLLYKPIYSFLEPRNLITKFFWKLISISLSVQYTTVPLSIYYFHYLPTYFILGNLVVLPLTTLLIPFAILATSLCGLTNLSYFFAKITEQLLEIICLATKIISSLPFCRLGPFFPSFIELITAYLILTTFYFFIKKRRFIYILIFFFLSILLMGSWTHTTYKKNYQQKIISYSLKENHITSLIKGNKAIILSDCREERLSIFVINQIQEGLKAQGINNTSWAIITEGKIIGTHIIEKYINWNGVLFFSFLGKKIALISKSCLLLPNKKEKIEVDILIIEQYLLPSINEWINIFQAKKIILGNTLTYYQRKDIIAFLNEKNIAYHDLYSQGACITNII